jgi:hypothetical protein
MQLLLARVTRERTTAVEKCIYDYCCSAAAAETADSVDRAFRRMQPRNI